MEGTLGVPNVMLFAGYHETQPCRAACESRVVGGDARASGRRPAGAHNDMQRMSGNGSSSSFSRSASATEGVRVTKIGVTNLGREQSRQRGAWLGESRERLLIEGSSAGLVSQEAARNRHRRQGAREAARRVERLGGMPNEAPGLLWRCRAIFAASHRRKKVDHLGSSVRGQPRRCEPGLGRSRSCSWIVPIAGERARRSSSGCESERSGTRHGSQALWSDKNVVL